MNPSPRFEFGRARAVSFVEAPPPANDLSPDLRPAPPGRTADPDEALCRLLDVVVAAAVLVLCLPLLLVLMGLITAQDGGPPLFRQPRIGRGGAVFGCLKLRTMVMDADERLERLLSADPEAREEWLRDHKLRRDPRITRLGAFLRRSSLDELPQLVNVLAGDMSLVGPRPIVTAETVRYGRRFRAYCSVPPGMTGLWQISGRNDVSYRRRVAMDVTYARRRSLALNLAILAATVPAVAFRKGSY